MWNRIHDTGGVGDPFRPPNYSLPTYLEWAVNRGAQQDRFAQFCWFLASTGGNFRLPWAGSWFPYCAKSRDVDDEINSSFGMGMSAEDVAKLTQEYYHINKETSVVAVSAMNEHVGRGLLAMPVAPPVAREPSEQTLGIKSPRLRALKKKIKQEKVAPWRSRPALRDQGRAHRGAPLVGPEQQVPKFRGVQRLQPRTKPLGARRRRSRSRHGVRRRILSRVA